MAKIRIKNKNSLPKGFTSRDGKVIKTYASGGATVSSTLGPVDRDAANLEAEKGEMALTDTTGDGVFELYDIGGKRHSEGGTPLNLPDQSFVYSDTKGMLLTIDEMVSLGIEGKKRITPAKAAKKFPLNNYIEILEDDTSDKIAIETAEQMISKNKVMLSQIAFIQESKKDFETGLPLAAFPYLMSKGIDPEEFQQKIMQMQAEKEGQGQASHQMPDGSMMPGATHGEDPSMAQGMPPQGGPQMPPPEMMQQMMAQQGPPQGGGMPPQGMMPPPPPTNGGSEQMMMGKYGGSLSKFKEGGDPLGDLLGMFNGGGSSNTTSTPVSNNQGAADSSEDYICPAYGNPPPSSSQMQDMTATPTFRSGGGLRKFIYADGHEVDEQHMTATKNNNIQLDSVVAPYEQNPYYAEMNNKMQMMQQQYAQALEYYQQNPQFFQEKEADEEFKMQLAVLQNQMTNIDYEMKEIMSASNLEKSMLDIESPNVRVQDVSQYTGTNPAMEGNQMMMAKNGVELSKYQVKGEHMCVGDNCTEDVEGGKDDHTKYLHDGQNTGVDDHMKFQNMINSDDFSTVKSGWLDAYKAKITQFKAIQKKKDDGGTLSADEQKLLRFPPVQGKTDQELFDGFMIMNQKLNQATAAGIDPKTWGQGGAGYETVCKQLGWGDCDNYDNSMGDVGADGKRTQGSNEGNLIWQGMFSAMQDLKDSEDGSPEMDQFFGNITTNLDGMANVGHTSAGGGNMSNIDGVIGWTSAGQGMSAENQTSERTITHDVPCDAETRAKKEKECAAKSLANPEAGWTFNLEECLCMTTPGDPELKDVPPYMTFPQDDLKLQNSIDTKWQREQYMPQRMNEQAIIPEVAYQDPQAALQANLSMAGQMAKMDPENASYYMGLISDKNNKTISDVANTNIKIFDNNQARVASALTANQAANVGYKDVYNTRSATAQNNFDNTRIADNENITNTQVDRMDNADKLFGINNENPNFYYDAQAHSNKFYNPEDMFAQDEINTNISMVDAKTECNLMGFEDNSAQMMTCIKQRMSGNTASSTQRNSIAEDDTEITKSKYGNEVGCTSCDNDKRRKDLYRSKKELRKWIFGVK
tara:strand:- start:3797 stop:7063 length:3267 start_codon:yes stop_codon:yes gene_type:complete